MCWLWFILYTVNNAYSLVKKQLHLLRTMSDVCESCHVLLVFHEQSLCSLYRLFRISALFFFKNASPTDIQKTSYYYYYFHFFHVRVCKNRIKTHYYIQIFYSCNLYICSSNTRPGQTKGKLLHVEIFVIFQLNLLKSMTHQC